LANSSIKLIPRDFLLLIDLKIAAMKTTLPFLALLLVSMSTLAQVADEQVLQINVTTAEDHLILNMEEDPDFSGSYTVFKKGPGDNSWTQLGTATSAEGAFKDEAIEKGKGYEYYVAKTSGSQSLAFGYVYAGVEKEAEAKKEGIILLVDSTLTDSLAFEISRLEDDLKAEGWTPQIMYAGRTESVVDIRDRILEVYTDASPVITTMLILGHVSVPYSGNFTQFGTPPPDGHVEGSGNHTGAWAADAFYADLDGAWTDNSANHSDAGLERGNNKPGDGKYDQDKIPSTVELAVGRIDLANMPAFQQSEIALLRNYLDRNHAFRTGEQLVKNQALIDNNFLAFNLASTGYHLFSTMFDEEDIATDVDYVEGQRADSYLWSYGCGAGSFTSCNGLFNGRANTGHIADEPLNNIFTVLAGSFFGDWDVSDNFLRAPLCNQSLISFWGGLPKWYVHHMALGRHIGYGVKLTQDNTTDYFNGQFNSSDNSIHIALMGDPTLTLRYLTRASELKASSSEGKVTLTWTAATGEVDGYNIYRIDSDGEYTKVNTAPITTTDFTDDNNWYTGDYTYAVRSVKLETTPSGSYYSLAGATTAAVEHVNTVSNQVSGLQQTHLYPNPTNGTLRISNQHFRGSAFQISVFHTSGKEVMNVAQQRFEDGAVLLNVSGLPRGSYFVALVLEDGSRVTKPFVKN